MNRTFPNGFEIGFSQGMPGSSSGGFFYNGNLNGGSSFGGNYNKGTFTTTSSYQGYTSSSFNPTQAVVQAEQSAREEYYSLKSMASGYQTQINNWFENHIIFESEFRIDYGAQIAGNVKALGSKIGFNIEKDTSPIIQANIDYNNGWKAAIYESGFMNKGEYSYGILDNGYRNEWSANLILGKDKTYYLS